MAQVDTSTGTYLANLFDPQVIADLINPKLTDNMVFGAVTMIDRTLEGQAGDTVTLPYFNYLGAASSVSEGYDLPIRKLTQSTKSVAVVEYGLGIQITDRAALSGYGDPIGQGAKQIRLAIDDALDNALLAALAANSASEQNYATANASTALEPEDIPLALTKFGEDVEGEKILYVTPEFHAKLVSKNWIPASEIAANIRVKGSVGMAYGCQVVISNRLISAGSLYIVKPDTLAVFMKRDVLVETDRDIVNRSTVVTGSIMCAPYLLNPTGMIKLSVGS